PTRRFLVLAGDRTINLDLDRARAYYRQAVELGQPRDPERPHLLVRTGRVAFQSGDYPEAVAVYEEAIADLRASGDLQGLGATLGRLATVLWNQGDTRRANTVLTEAIELLEREPPTPSRSGTGRPPAPSWSRPMSAWPATGSCPVTPPRPSTGPTRPWPWPTSWAGCPASGPAPSTSAGWPAATSATSAAWTTSGRGWPSGWSWGRATTRPWSTTNLT